MTLTHVNNESIYIEFDSSNYKFAQPSTHSSCLLLSLVVFLLVFHPTDASRPSSLFKFYPSHFTCVFFHQAHHPLDVHSPSASFSYHPSHSFTSSTLLVHPLMLLFLRSLRCPISPFYDLTQTLSLQVLHLCTPSSIKIYICTRIKKLIIDKPSTTSL